MPAQRRGHDMAEGLVLAMQRLQVVQAVDVRVLDDRQEPRPVLGLNHLKHRPELRVGPLDHRVDLGERRVRGWAIGLLALPAHGFGSEGPTIPDAHPSDARPRHPRRWWKEAGKPTRLVALEASYP